VLERLIVRAYIYPSLLTPPLGLCFTDQFAFRPTGSTTAALITLIHTVLTMLSVDPFVRVFALDFSKAFDMLRHSTLLEKMACLDLPDEVYNWILHFFTGRSHTTKFAGEVSSCAEIFASVRLRSHWYEYEYEFRVRVSVKLHRSPIRVSVQGHLYKDNSTRVCLPTISS